MCMCIYVFMHIYMCICMCMCIYMCVCYYYSIVVAESEQCCRVMNPAMANSPGDRDRSRSRPRAADAAEHGGVDATEEIHAAEGGEAEPIEEELGVKQEMEDGAEPATPGEPDNAIEAEEHFDAQFEVPEQPDLDVLLQRHVVNALADASRSAVDAANAARAAAEAAQAQLLLNQQQLMQWQQSVMQWQQNQQQQIQQQLVMQAGTPPQGLCVPPPRRNTDRTIMRISSSTISTAIRVSTSISISNIVHRTSSQHIGIITT